MKIKKKTIQQVIFLGAIFLIMLGLFWANMKYIKKVSAGRKFLVNYAGTQAFLAEGDSPYGEPGIRQVEEVFTKAGVTLKGENYSAPIYISLFYAPFSLLKNPQTAAAFWMLLMEICLAAAGFFSLTLLDWRVTPINLTVIMVIFLVSPLSMLALVQGSISPLVLLGVILSLMFLKRERFLEGALCLALSSVQPMMIFLITPFIVLRNLIQKQWQMVFSFLMFSAVLGLTPLLFLNTWILEWLRTIASSFSLQLVQDSLVSTIAGVFPGLYTRLFFTIYLVIAVYLVVEWVVVSKNNREWFLWTGMLTLEITLLLVFPQRPAFFLLHLPGIILALFMASQRWEKNGQIIFLLQSALILLGGWLLVFLAGNKSVINLVFCIYTLIGLWWSRWWYTHPLIRNTS